MRITKRRFALMLFLLASLLLTGCGAPAVAANDSPPDAQSPWMFVSMQRDFNQVFP